MRSFIGGIFAFGLAGFAALACSTALDAGADAPAPSEPVFTSEDASADVLEAGVAFTSYCPSNKCPAGYTTCPDSRFPCEVNLLTDRKNCGACGAACPLPTQSEVYECIDGRCVMQCNGGNPPNLDCDGLVDNGCEAKASAQDSCGACGVICTDPDKWCINRNKVAPDYGCGCRDNKTICRGECVDTKTDDYHCGECNHLCPHGELDPSLNMYYGCRESKCGALKCIDNYANCDGDIDNGCETYLGTPENCGSCGTACSSEQTCLKDTSSQAFTCMCPPGQALCQWGLFGICVDFSSDASNCGGCGILCDSVCVNGTCQTECGGGFADCNGSAGDGCEVNVASDPNNCGGCGITCNGIVGQACVQGRCVVEPCDEAVDAGKGPK